MPCTQHNEKHGVWWWHHHRKMYYILINCRCARASCVMPMARQCLRWQYLKLVKQNRWQQYSMYRCHIPCYRCIRSCSQCASTGIIVIINGANTPAERQKKTSLPTGREITRRHLNVQMANVIAHGGQDSFIASHCFEHIQCDCLFSTYIHFPAVMPAAIVNIARALQTRDGHSWLLNNEILWRIYGIRSQFVRAICVFSHSCSDVICVSCNHRDIKETNIVSEFVLFSVDNTHFAAGKYTIILHPTDVGVGHRALHFTIDAVFHVRCKLFRFRCDIYGCRPHCGI